MSIYTDCGKEFSQVAVFFCLVALGFTDTAVAQDDEGSIRLGNGDFSASLQLDYSVNNNRDRTQTNLQELSGFTLSPSVGYSASKASVEFGTFYSGRYSRVDDDRFDFEDHKFGLGVRTSISKKFKVGADLRSTTSHKERELSDRLADSLSALETSRSTELTLGFRYGASGARGNLSGDVKFADFSFDDVDGSGDASDYSLVVPSLELSIRVSPDTRITLGIDHGIYDYKENSRDRSISKLLAGLQFAPTGKIRGFIKVGSATTVYENNSESDSTDFVFSSVIEYRINSFSSLSFRGERRFDNTSDSDFIATSLDSITDTLSVSWNHDWGSRVGTSVNATFIHNNEVCPSDSSDLSRFSAQADYQIFNSHRIGLRVQNETRSGDYCGDPGVALDDLDYDRQIYGVYWRWST